MRKSVRIAACVVPLLTASPLIAGPAATRQAATHVNPQPEFQRELEQLRGAFAPMEAEPAPRRGQPRLIGGDWATSDRVVMGVGLFRVPKIDRNDPNRNHPLRDPSGKTTGAAALGLSFSF